MAKTLSRMRWSDHELGLIKSTFAEQEELLILFRKFLLQGEMSDSELKYLKSFTSSPEILAILKKAINPKLDKQATAFNSVDMLSSIDLNPVPADHAYLIIKSKVLADKFLAERFAALEGNETEGINFDELIIPSDDEKQTYVNLNARNTILAHVDFQLFNKIAIIAGTKDETPEQQKKRLSMDSSK